MSMNVVRSRLISNFSKLKLNKSNDCCGRRSFSSNVAFGAPTPELIVSTQSMAADLYRPSRRLLRPMRNGSRPGGFSTYSSDEIEEKAKALQESVNHIVPDDASSVEGNKENLWNHLLLNPRTYVSSKEVLLTKITSLKEKVEVIEGGDAMEE